jgi:hypothetical protein
MASKGRYAAASKPLISTATLSRLGTLKSSSQTGGKVKKKISVRGAGDTDAKLQGSVCPRLDD